MKQQLHIVDGLMDFFPQCYDPTESHSLFENLRNELLWRQDQIKMFGKIYDVPRLQAWYGDEGISYSYSGIKLEPLEWHPLLLQVKNRVEGLTKTSYNSVLANLYRNGQDSNGWHADNEPELGQNPSIASISLGTARLFQLKHRYKKEQRCKILLNDGSLFHMHGTTQHFWLHQIAKTKKVDTARVNLTFRYIHKSGS